MNKALKPIRSYLKHKSTSPEWILMDGTTLDVLSLATRIINCGSKNGKVRSGGLIRAGLTLHELFLLIQEVKNIFVAESTLLDLDGPINVVGDLHGQFTDLLRIFEGLGHLASSDQKYLFLGDYVDRGPNSIETISLLFALKIAYPERVFLLRGNHETPEISRIYGFYDECKRRYTVKLWRYFTDCFRYLPLAAVIGKRVFCAHGGINPGLRSIYDLKDLRKPIDVADQGLVTDILWSDPDPDIQGWGNSYRGVSYVYGLTVLDDFLRNNELDLICRAHEVVEDGYEFMADRRLITIFSATNYCGQFDNAGGVLRIDADLVCRLFILKPLYRIKSNLTEDTDDEINPHARYLI